jgi:alginate O-acetyltransferase complex protein AlgI
MFARLTEGSVGFANVSPLVWLVLALAIVLHYLPSRWYEGLMRLYVWLPAPARAVGLVSLALVVRQVASVEVKPYIYFQF